DVTVSSDTALDSSCTHRATLHIAVSGVVLDCRHSRIDAAGREFGIVVGGRQSVRDVTVRNCSVTGGGTGIFIGLLESDAAKLARHGREALYEITPHDVRIEDSSVQDSTGVGIFVDDYASRVVVSRVAVKGSGSAGIYLEHSSRNNRVLDSTITGNGFGKFPRLRFGKSRREGIAVDSSAHNHIEGNRISGNAAGGIFLYKNCHEYATSNPHSVPRWQHSDHNLITGNVIEIETVGVWLASRQSRDLSGLDCGDAPYSGTSHFLDHAAHNVVDSNTFKGVTTGVVVEDDFNTVSGNTFLDTGLPIEIRAHRRREVLGRSVEGTTVRDNIVVSPR
ncbi:MAG TPA: right-handed parallel beta-helix repeat-containing protein, partial [Burkholderiales bacterium]